MQLVKSSDIRIEPGSKLATLSDPEQSALRDAMATFVNGEYNGVDEKDPARVSAIGIIRDAYKKVGQFEEQLCDSKTCLNFAEVTLNWPVLPGQRKPRYCKGCGDWAANVLETLGHAAFPEPFDNPALKDGVELPFGKRSINLDG